VEELRCDVAEGSLSKSLPRTEAREIKRASNKTERMSRGEENATREVEASSGEF